MGALSVAIAAGLAALGGAFGVAIIAKAVIESTARQPELSGRFQTLLFIGAPLAEALPILAIVIAFMLYGQL